MLKKIISISLCLAFAITMLLTGTCVAAAENYADGTGTVPSNYFNNNFISLTGAVTSSSHSVIVTEDAANNTVTYENDSAGTAQLSQMALLGSFYNVNSGFGITYTAGERYVFGGIKVRNISETAVTPKFGFEILCQGTSVGNSNVYHMVDVTATGDDWQNYAGVVTVAHTDGGTGSRLMVGMPHGNISGFPAEVAGAKVLADVSGAYFAKEARTISNEIVGTTVVGIGSSTTAKAQVVNQVGLTSDFDQTMTFVALNADRSAIAEGIEVVPANDGTGTYTINVGDDVEPGSYVVLARSSAYYETEGLQKGVTITVEELNYDDYVPAAGTNYFNGDFISRTQPYTNSSPAIAVTENVEDNTITYEYVGGTGQISQMALGGSFYNVNSGFGITYTAGERYVFGGIKLKNLSNAGITPKFGFEILCQGTSVGNSNVYHMVDVTATGDNWQDYAGVVEVAYTDGGSGSRLMLGMPNGVISGFPDEVAGSKVLADVSGAYFAKEIKSVSNVLTGSAYVDAGSSTTAKAQVVNQLGGTTGLEQGFTYIVLDGNRTTTVDGISVVPANDGTGAYTINVGAGVPAGEYVILARSNAYYTADEALQKGVAITVIDRDYEDYVPATVSGSFDFIAKTGHVAGTATANMLVTVSEDSEANTVAYEHGTGSTYLSQMYLDGSFSNANSNWGMVFTAGERYVLGGIKLKNVSDAGVTPTFGFELLSQSTTAGNSSSTVYDVVEVTATGDNWQDYAGVVTIAETDGGTGSRLMVGMPHGKKTGGPAKVTGAKVLADVSGAYFAKEVVSITNTATSATTVPAGGTFSATAKVVNQVGLSTGLDQTFQVIVVDANRQNIVEGFTVSEIVNGSYTVTVGEDVPEGEYVVLARNMTNIANTTMNKGITITVGETIEGISLTKESDGKVTVATDVQLTDAQLIYVSYDENGKMVDYSFVDVTLAPQGKQSYGYKADFITTDDIRVMLWSDTIKCIPLTDVIPY